MKNNLADLNNHLFAMLETLENDEEMADTKKLQDTLMRSRAVCQVAAQILNVARLQVSAINTAEQCGLQNSDMPALIKIKDSKAEQKKQLLLEGK